MVKVSRLELVNAPNIKPDVMISLTLGWSRLRVAMSQAVSNSFVMQLRLLKKIYKLPLTSRSCIMERVV